jgi:glycosyltransferase involved in cell wall biosynthesis
MRILIATTHRQIVGGVETYLHEVLPALCRRGHEVALLHEHPAATGHAVVDEGVGELSSWCIREDNLAETLRQVRGWRPDVAYLQGVQSLAAERALLESFPSVRFAHNYHGTCVSGTKRHAFPCARPCDRTFGVGCLLSYYPRRCGGLNPLTLLREYRLQRERLKLLPHYQAVCVASAHMRAEHRRHGVPEQRLHLLPLFPAGLEPDPTPPADRPLGRRVLMVGRLTDLKGGRLLIEAVARASTLLGRTLTLVVAGDGPERAYLESLARRLGAQTEFLGWVSPDKRTQLMREADLLAVPSVWPEPFGLVGIEAGCVGLPAVGFAVGGITDWLRPGESGELAPASPPTAAALAAALGQALADPVHLNRLRHGAWQVAQRYTRQGHVAALEAILEQASTAAPSRGAREVARST